MKINLELAAVLSLGVAVAVAVSIDGGTQPDDSPTEPLRRWYLPGRLDEISGLALTPEQRLLAVADELAVVYEIDHDRGRVVKTFALGRPALRGDFEGIAVMRGRIWLMTSDGSLYASREGADGERVSYKRYASGLGEGCELEGLTAIEERGALLLSCKKPEPRLYEWAPDAARARRIDLPEKAMARAVGRRSVKPSGVERDPESGEVLIVAAAQHAVFRLSPTGELIGVAMRLEEAQHPQAEGISLTSDGRLLIADEAAGGRARLAVYPPAALR